MDFEQLPRDVPPPAGLEDRTVAALHQHGLLRRRRRPLLAWGQRVAAAVLLLAAGAWFGAAWNARSGAPASTAPRFLLLLGGASPVSAGDEPRVFEEYRAWAGRLRHSGRLVSGERLGAESVAVPASRTHSADPIQGYFVVSADDIADAVAVAESSPHVARGGQVIVRPINTQ